jgi:hypothetical protein
LIFAAVLFANFFFASLALLQALDLLLAALSFFAIFLASLAVFFTTTFFLFLSIL